MDSILLVTGGLRHDAAEGVIQHGRIYLSTYFVRCVGVNGGSFERQYGRGAYCACCRAQIAESSGGAEPDCAKTEIMK